MNLPEALQMTSNSNHNVYSKGKTEAMLILHVRDSKLITMWLNNSL